jgi:predicted RNA-binding Zn-ribbon protein involved in translation (DUF1610 family)
VDEQTQIGRGTEAGAGHPCPACGSRDVAEIVYGYPAFDQEWQAKLEAGEWAIGGCVIEPDQPDYECHACGSAFRRDASVVEAESPR